MQTLATTRMSSKGQVVIPEAIRQRLDLKEGSEFLVLADRDFVLLKTLVPPSPDEFDQLLNQARKQARAAGMKRSDIAKALRQVRSNR